MKRSEKVIWVCVCVYISRCTPVCEILLYYPQLECFKCVARFCASVYVCTLVCLIAVPMDLRVFGFMDLCVCVSNDLRVYGSVCLRVCGSVYMRV